jgi:hypothetical protein
VVVAANGAETPRLLLASESARFPDGLANSSGLVGKYLMFNYSSRVDAVFEQELNEYKSVQVTRVVHDFYDADLRRGFYGGGIDARIGPQPAIWAQRLSADGPAWGAAFKARLREFPRSMNLLCHGTSLPVATNAVSLDPTLKDAWDRPAIRVTYKDHPDDLANARFMQDRGVEIMEAAGAQRVARSNSGAELFHALAGYLPLRQRRTNLSHRSLSSNARCAQSISLRWQQPGYLRPWSAHYDHSSLGVSRRRSHRSVRARRGDLSEPSRIGVAGEGATRKASRRSRLGLLPTFDMRKRMPAANGLG